MTEPLLYPGVNVYDANGTIVSTFGGSGGGAVTIANGQDTAEGSTTDAAVVSDANGTVSGKLRGLVKILADVWDSTNHKLKVTGGLQPSATTVHSDVTSSATSQTVLAANSLRNGGSIYNDSTAILYLKKGATAATSSNFSVKLFAEDFYEISDGWTGAYTGIWASANGAARVEELTT